mgnify:CR=1 FL=1
MNIALICTEKLPVPPIAGGAIQMYIDGILPYLSSRHNITVYSIQHPNLPNEEFRDNVRYIRVPGKTDTIYVSNLKSSIAGSCGTDGLPPYDLIHVFNRPKNLLALSQAFPGQKFSLSLHNEMFHPDKISDEAGLTCIEKAEFINTVSRYIADTVTRRFPAAEGKMHVVYSGADYTKYTPAWTPEGAAKKHAMKSKFGLQDRRVILYVGRLSIKKGVHILVKAMERVMQTHPDTALVIAGSKWYGNNESDDYTNSLRALVKKLPGPVILTGFIPPADIPDYYCIGDIFVCASQWNEPLARVHYEAMAAGLPIITTNRGGNAEVLSDSSESCGIVLDQHNDPDIMADKIRFMLDHPELCMAMGRAGRKKSEEKYNWRRVADEIFERVEQRTVGDSPSADGDGSPVVTVWDSPSTDGDGSIVLTIGDSPSTDGDGSSVVTVGDSPSTDGDGSIVVTIGDSPSIDGDGSSVVTFGDSPSTDGDGSPAITIGDSPSVSSVTIIGAGYVGLVTGVCLASAGIDVMCCDQDSSKIGMLNSGVMPIFEPSLQNLAVNCIRRKKLSFTNDICKAVSHSDIIFITVNTPTLPDNTCDTSHVFEVARSIGTYMDRYKVIVNKSTVPVGTGKNVKRIISSALESRGCSITFDVVSNPEFLREGSAVYDFIYPDRIVIGSESSKAADLIREVYRKQLEKGTPLVLTDIETAEMIKYASNAFLATKISLINEIANLCESCGVDITMVTKGMGLDKRIGPHFLNPGPGFGGSCFPKDVRALTALGSQFDCEVLLLRSVLDVNRRQQERMISKIDKALAGQLDGASVTVLGLSFKPGTDDIRESPAVSIISSLLERNASIAVYDPRAMENMKKEYPQMNLKYCEDAYSASFDSECIILVTEWKEFSDLDFKKLKSMVKKPVFMDLRNVYEPEYVKSFGFYYEGVGRK